jgi:glycosyltransferase involved in cell wall biosynthesis
MCGDKYEILLVTGNKDIDNTTFTNIKFNKILKKKKFKILYLSEKKTGYLNFKEIINTFDPDTIYLNSFFDYDFSIKIALLNKIFFKKKIVISPRGELYKEALKIKKIKKKIFLFFSNVLKIYQDTIFQVNSTKEKKELLKVYFLKLKKIEIVPVLYSELKSVKISNLSIDRKTFKILYVSRIVKNKNLDFCLSVLQNINIEVNFIIIGPIEDKKYWNMCKKKFFNLNKNIKINYLGHKKKNYINKIMKRSHCLFLPSKFESFGHVIFESFLNGLPVITSKYTPWKNLKKKKVGADLALPEIRKFIYEIKALKLCSKKKYRSIRMNALSYSKKIIDQNKIYKRKDLF